MKSVDLLPLGFMIIGAAFFLRSPLAGIIDQLKRIADAVESILWQLRNSGS